MDKGTKTTMKSSWAEDEGSRGMAWCYYMVTVLAEDPGLSSSTHMVSHSHLYVQCQGT